MKNSYLVTYSTGKGGGMININTSNDLKYSDLMETRNIIFEKVKMSCRGVELKNIIILNISKGLLEGNEIR